MQSNNIFPLLHHNLAFSQQAGWRFDAYDLILKDGCNFIYLATIIVYIHPIISIPFFLIHEVYHILKFMYVTFSLHAGLNCEWFPREYHSTSLTLILHFIVFLEDILVDLLFASNQNHMVAECCNYREYNHHFLFLQNDLTVTVCVRK